MLAHRMTDAGQSASSSADAAGTRKGLGIPLLSSEKPPGDAEIAAMDMPVGPPEAPAIL
jgi:hypothetical protein